MDDTGCGDTHAPAAELPITRSGPDRSETTPRHAMRISLLSTTLGLAIAGTAPILLDGCVTVYQYPAPVATSGTRVASASDCGCPQTATVPAYSAAPAYPAVPTYAAAPGYPATPMYTAAPGYYPQQPMIIYIDPQTSQPIAVYAAPPPASTASNPIGGQPNSTPAPVATTTSPIGGRPAPTDVRDQNPRFGYQPTTESVHGGPIGGSALGELHAADAGTREKRSDIASRAPSIVEAITNATLEITSRQPQDAAQHSNTANAPTGGSISAAPSGHTMPVNAATGRTAIPTDARSEAATSPKNSKDVQSQVVPTNDAAPVHRVDPPAKTPSESDVSTPQASETAPVHAVDAPEAGTTSSKSARSVPKSGGAN